MWNIKWCNKVLLSKSMFISKTFTKFSFFKRFSADFLGTGGLINYLEINCCMIIVRKYGEWGQNAEYLTGNKVMEKDSKAETSGLQCRKFVYFFRLIVFFGSQIKWMVVFYLTLFYVNTKNSKSNTNQNRPHPPALTYNPSKI